MTEPLTPEELSELGRILDGVEDQEWEYKQLPGWGAENFIINKDEKAWVRVVAHCHGGPFSKYQLMAFCDPKMMRRIYEQLNA